jgi:hypothetical protein
MPPDNVTANLRIIPIMGLLSFSVICLASTATFMAVEALPAAAIPPALPAVSCNYEVMFIAKISRSFSGGGGGGRIIYNIWHTN